MPEGHPPRYFTLTSEQLAGYEVEEESPKLDKKDKKDRALPKEVEDSLDALRIAMDERFTEFGGFSPGIETLAMPKEFTESHLEAMKEFFGKKNLEATAFPKTEHLTDKYFEAMFPAGQRQQDSDRGLVSYRLNWWKETAGDNFAISEDEAQRTHIPRATWGDLYIKSMHAEAAEMHGALLLSETIQKPSYTDGTQQYGTKEGTDASQDQLLPVIKEVFGDDANRFNLTWDQINQELLPKLKEKLTEVLKAKGLTTLENLDIIVTPALISNLQTTLKHSTDSETNTYDWTSTTLLTQKDQDSGSRLLVGLSDSGGAGYVNNGGRDGTWGGRGFRLSVVLKST